MRKLERATGDEQAIHDRRWWILATLCVCLLVVVIDNTILNVALPDIQRELGATQTAEQWFLDAYTLTFAALLFSAGVLGDRYGRVRALVVGLSIFGLGSLLCAFAPSPNWLIGFRALQAGGGALVLPSTLSIINYTFEGEERGRAVGVWAGVSGLAIAIGPITGGLLLEFFWWGSVFLVNVPIVVIGIALIVLVIPESRDPDPGELDPRGVLLSILGLVAVVFGIVRIGQQNGIDTWSIASIVVGAIVLAIFVLAERRSDHPSLDVSLFKDARFSAAALAVTSAFFALFGSTFFLTFYLQFDRMYSPLQAGIRLLPVAVAVVSFSPLSSRLVARFGIRIVCTAGLLTVAGAFAIYQIIDTGTNIWVLEGLLFIQGTGLANVIPPATDSILSVLPREKSGAGSAVNRFDSVGAAPGEVGCWLGGEQRDPPGRRSIGHRRSRIHLVDHVRARFQRPRRPASSPAAVGGAAIHRGRQSDREESRRSAGQRDLAGRPSGVHPRAARDRARVVRNGATRCCDRGRVAAG